MLGGGGYNPWTLARCWTGLWGLLSGRDIPDALPPEAQLLLADLECDLVDDEDLKCEWFKALADAPNEGTVRAEIQELVARQKRERTNELD